MKTAARQYRLAMTAGLLSLQVFFYLAGAVPVLAAGNDNTNSTPSQGRYVGKGVEASIRALLCAPTDVSNASTTQANEITGQTVANDNPAAGDLAKCINRGYRFALAFGAVAAVFFVVLAGYMYMVGGENGKHEAKSVIISVLVGFLIMLSSFVLLKQINPSLVAFRTIQPPQIGGIYTLASCRDVKLGEDCILPDGTKAKGDGTGGGVPVGGAGGVAGCTTKEQGGCSKSIISQCPAFASQMDNALRACNQESMGGKVAIASGSDQCTELSTNKVISFSWGLWQLNIAAGSTGAEFPECKGVLTQVGGPWSAGCLKGTCGRTCRYTQSQSAFDACTRALADPNRNTKQACTLYNERVKQGRDGWGPWPWTKKVCNLP